MSSNHDSLEHFALSNESGGHAAAARQRFSDEASNYIGSPSALEAGRVQVAGNEVKPIPLPPPAPEPPVHTGITKDGKPFIVIETPYEFT